MRLSILLRKIIELKNPYPEAIKKLSNTWMFVNGKLEYIKTIKENTESLIIVDHLTANNIEVKKVETLEPWLPVSGIYPLKNGSFALIKKTPQRQWLKSFSETFYTIEVIGKPTRFKNVNSLDKIEENCIQMASQAKVTKIYIDTVKNIWWMDIIIGYIKNSKTIVCTDKNFSQELKDWSKNA